MVNFEYPLQWPPAQPRTKRRERARFENHSASRAGDELVSELERMGAKKCVISSNLETRMRGGGFYARQEMAGDEPGVAVYFELKGAPKVMACDRWSRPEHNLWALKLSVAAIRGLDRWGGSEFLDGLFTGFTALPSPDQVTVTAPQYFADCVNMDNAKARYKNLVKELHPDVGGDSDQFMEMQRQYEQYRKSEDKGK